MTKANANALFQGLKSKPSFTKTITIFPGDPEEAILLEARSEIRKAIRAAFANFQSVMLTDAARENLLAKRDFNFQRLAKSIPSLDVRFLTQGSHAYQTLIRPAHPSHQEIDLDDGIYIPMPFLNGRPLFSSDGLFQVISHALTPLVKLKGWTFKRKDTCIRVCLTGMGAHIDLPLFAVEETAFQSLSSVYDKRAGVSFRKTKVSLNKVFDSSARDIRLSESNILLADREEDWRPSDPKLIHDWFEDQVKRYGPVLRRVCRYIKGWRDESWHSCSLSSLTVMAACVQAFAKLKYPPSDKRDDLIVLEVAKALSLIFLAGGIVWRDGLEALDADWSPDDRKKFVNAAEALATEIDAALNNTFHSEIVVSRLQNAFGERFPDAPEAIDISAANQTAEVLETKAVSVAMPVVGTSVSA